MTKEELNIIAGEEFGRVLEAHLDDDPIAIALSNSIPHAALVATQVKYLQKARKKLPMYYAARAIFTQKLFEQSSSEASAMNKEFSGDSCIDLTCGLGVDSYYLSKRFNHVTAIEKDELAAEIARINFRRMGADNVEVICDSAEHYIERCNPVDMIYIDPDRRDKDNKRLAALSDCTPDVVNLSGILRAKCRKFVIKCSPLFDVEEAFALFGERCRVEVVSLGGECKEVLIEVDDRIERSLLRATSVGLGSYEIERDKRDVRCKALFSEEAKYLLLPDVALRKARMADAYMCMNGAAWFENNGVGLSNISPSDFMGRVYEICRMVEYKPKQLKSLHLGSIELMRMNFPLSTAQICRSINVKEGGNDRWMFCKLHERLWAIEIKELSL